MKSEENTKAKTIPLSRRNLSRDNHYLPQMYLSGWSADGKCLWVHRNLVFNENCPEWEDRPLKHTGMWKNLYVRVADNQERDDYELMFNRRFETPADAPMKAARNDERLTPADWRAIIRFICAQHVRTPAYYVSTIQTISEAAQEAIEKSTKALQNMTEPLAPSVSEEGSVVQDLIPISMTFSDLNDSHSAVKVETTIGKGAWLFAIHHHLEEGSPFLNALCAFKWSIATAPDGYSWPTSDNPLVLGSLLADQRSICVSGINNANVILFPISSEKLLITTPGRRLPPRFTASEHEAKAWIELIVKNSFLYLYSIKSDASILDYKQRVVDLQEAKRLQEEFDSWYDMYQEKEVPFLTKKYRVIEKRAHTEQII